MTVEPVAPPRAAEPAGQTNADWRKALTERVDSRWRPGEWDPIRLRFLGDPDNPATKVFRCAVDGCPCFALGSGGLCQSCGCRRNRVGQPKDFIENFATYAPNRRYGDPDMARSFSLADLTVGLRTEILFGLQVLDRDRILVPELVRKLLARLPAATESLLEVTEDVIAGLQVSQRGLARSLRSVLLADRVQFTGTDATLGDVWDCQPARTYCGSSPPVHRPNRTARLSTNSPDLAARADQGILACPPTHCRALTQHSACGQRRLGRLARSPERKQSGPSQHVRHDSDHRLPPDGPEA